MVNRIFPPTRDSVFYYNTHAASSAGDHGHSGLQRSCVQVGHFGLSDLLDLLFGDGGYLVLVGNAGSLVNAASTCILSFPL